MNTVTEKLPVQGGVLRPALRIAASTLVARGCGVLGGLVSAAAFAPAAYGVFTFLRAMLGTGGWTHLGSVEAYRREWPRLMAAGCAEEAAVVERAAHRLAMILPLGFWAAAAGIAGWISQTSPAGFVAENHWSIQALLATMLPIAGEAVRIEWLSVRGAMPAVARLRVVRGLAYATTIPLGAFSGGVLGAAIALLAAEWMTCACAARECRRLRRESPRAIVCGPQATLIPLAARLIRLGFPITLIWQCVVFFDSVDRTVLIRTLGERAAGLHALGALAATAAFAVPEALSRVLHPRMCADAGRSDDDAVARRVDGVTTVLTLWMPSALLALAFFIEPILDLLLPSYADAGETAAILVVGAGLTALVPSGVDWLIATGRVRRFLLLGPAVLLLRAVLVWMAADLSGDIRAVACAGVASTAVFVVLLELFSGRVGRARRLLERVLPGLLAVVLVVLVAAPWLDAWPLRLLTALGAVALHHMLVRGLRILLAARQSQAASERAAP